MATLYKAHLFHLTGNPGLDGARAALREHQAGGLLVDARGTIVAAGNLDEIAIPDGTLIENFRRAVLLPGFVDAHLHFPQVYAQLGFGGGQLLDWLEGCIFEAEARLADPAFARRAAEDFCSALLKAGTTCALVFGSEFPTAQEALFTRVAEVGLRAIIGRTAMVTGPKAAEALLTSEADAVRLAREEIAQWHPAKGQEDQSLIHVALVPRFALSMTPSALRAFGELHAEHADRGLYLTTHLSENDGPVNGEVEQVLRTFRVGRYLDVYDGRFLPGSKEGGPSLLGRRSVFAHGVHCSDDELMRLGASGSSLAHCPISQLFLGSGTMPWRRVRAARVRIAAGTDVGASDTFSIPDVLNAAYKVHLSAPLATALHPAELLHLGTLGGAQALALDHRIGNLDAGKEADFVVYTLDDDPRLAERFDTATTPESRLFTLLLALGRLSPTRVVVRGRTIAS